VHVDAAALGSVNVPAGGEAVLDATTAIAEAAAGPAGPTITLTAEQLGAVNIPEPLAAAKHLQLAAKDLASINVPSGESSAAATPALSRTASRVVEVRAADLANVNQREA
jgi:hypothetical protein